MQNYYERAATLFEKDYAALCAIPEEIQSRATDICIAVGHGPLLFLGRERYVVPKGSPCTAAEMEELIYRLCDYSVYKHVEELKKGYIAVSGGFRVGICGTAVVSEKGIETIADIRSFLLRIPHSPHGAAEELLARTGEINEGLLIIGEPSSGKTTILRDLITVLSQRRLAVLDERFELTAGKTEKNISLLCGYPKSEGMQQALRNLGAEIILCDELEQKDLQAIEQALAAGALLVATVHGVLGGTIRPFLRQLVETGAFGKIVELQGREQPCGVKKIWKAGEFLEASRSAVGPSHRGSGRFLSRTKTSAKNRTPGSFP